MDDTMTTIERTAEAKKSYEDAFEILVRRAVPGEAARQVHWYHLRRMTPKFEPNEKDDWSLPGELSPEAAIAYFEKHEGFGGGLELRAGEDFSADFTLEQREAIRKQYGASQRISPGDLIQTFFVRHKRRTLAGFQVLRDETDFDGVIVHAHDERNALVIARIPRSALEDALRLGGERRPTIAQCADIVECNGRSSSASYRRNMPAETSGCWRDTGRHCPVSRSHSGTSRAREKLSTCRRSSTDGIRGLTSVS